jgi:hypothetical protein
MYTLRCTKPLLDRLGPLTKPGAGPPPPTTTALGDWYAKRVNVGRHRLVLCTNERSLLSVVVTAKDLPGLPQRLIESLVALLRRMGVPPSVIADEAQEMQWVRFDKTASRSVLGSMDDFAIAADWFFRRPVSVAYLDDLDWRLSETPCGPLDYQQPRERARELLLGAA